jgi:hypothetical protein
MDVVLGCRCRTYKIETVKKTILLSYLLSVTRVRTSDRADKTLENNRISHLSKLIHIVTNISFNIYIYIYIYIYIQYFPEIT